MLSYRDWDTTNQFKRYKVIFRDNNNDKRFLSYESCLGQTLTDHLHVGVSLNITIARHSKNSELRFCTKCCKSESRMHYVFYCERFMKERNLLHDQINQISEKFTLDDLDIFEILGGSQYDLKTKIKIEECLQTYCLRIKCHVEYIRDYKRLVINSMDK